MDISRGGIVFQDRAPQAAAKCAADFFAGKREAESQKHNRPVQERRTSRKDTSKGNKKEPDNPYCLMAYGLSALRLCARFF